MTKAMTMDEKTSKARARFWAKVNKTAHCWNWLGYKDPDGYGVMRALGKRYRAHRRAWLMAYGSLPEDLCVLHRCDNRACVRPSHMFLGTHADNVCDCQQKGRLRRGENHPRAKLTTKQVKAMRREHEAERHSVTALALRYDTSIANASDIIRRNTWRHV